MVWGNAVHIYDPRKAWATVGIAFAMPRQRRESEYVSIITCDALAEPLPTPTPPSVCLAGMRPANRHARKAFAPVAGNGVEWNMAQRVTCARIYVDNVRHNVGVARARANGAAICAAVKANGYGHGEARVAQALVEEGVEALGVATVDEAITAREAGIDVPILLYSYASSQEYEQVVAYRIEPFIGDVEYARELNAYMGEHAGRLDGYGLTAGAHGLAAHLKVDSGMGRIGCRPAAAGEMVAAIEQEGHLRVASVATHLADATDREYTDEQIRRFARGCDAAERAAGRALPRHCANSAALLEGSAPVYDMARPGIMLYGYHSDPQRASAPLLRPVMELRSRIVMVKDIEKGTAVSYGMTWRASRRTRIATVPIGYGDGYCRLLSNRASVIVIDGAGNRAMAPIVGRICMDQLMIDIGGAPSARRGDEVILFGDQQGMIGVDRLAVMAETISYELLCMVGARVRREYVD